MIIDWKDNAVIPQNISNSLIKEISHAVKRLIKNGIIKTQRQNVNLYITPSVVSCFKSVYLASLPKRSRKKYQRFISKGMVMIGGHWLRIMANDVIGGETADDDYFNCYVRPV